MSKPRGVTSLDVTRAYEIAERLESEVMGVVDDLLTRLRVCGECGHPRERHVGEAGACGGCIGVRKSEEVCKEFVWTVTVGEIVGTLGYMKSMTRHQERIDADLGLDKKQTNEQIPWLVGVNVIEFKRATPAEKERMMLTAMEGGPVLDAEVVEPEGGEATGATDADRK